MSAIRPVLTMTMQGFRRAVACFGLLLTIQGSVSAQEAELAGTVVEGTVTDAAGEPLGDITIRAVVLTEPEPQAESSSDGRFRLDLGQHPRNYAMLIASSSDDELQGFHQLRLSRASESDAALVIVLKPARTIDVVVRDAEGNPVPEAAIEVGSGLPLIEGVTDDEGCWQGRLPLDVPIGSVIALKDGVGFDYYDNDRRFETEPNERLPDVYALTLDGAIELEVLATTDDGEPVPGVELQPWYIQTGTDRAERVNISGSRIVRTATDERGIAVFRWFPVEFEQSIPILVRSDEWHAPDWPSLRSGAVVRRLTYLLRRMVPISGRVLDADGQPIAGIRVSIAGEGANFRDNHRTSILSDTDGRYEALVPPRLSYIITVDDDEWASENLMDVPIYDDGPRDDLDLGVIPGTLIHGNLRRPDGSPLAGERVTLHLDGEQVPFKPDDDSRTYHAPSLIRWAETDETGRFELRVGPGSYRILGPDRRNSQELTIADQAELRIDFEYEPLKKQPLVGLVVRADDDDTIVPDAVVSGVSIDPDNYLDIAVETDGQGRFATERLPSRMLLRAMSGDGEFGAFREISRDDTDVVIAVSPTSSAVGRIVDEQGRPTAGFKFRYAIEVTYPNGTMTSRFGGTAVTDDDGRFRLEHLVVDREYECRHERNGTYYLVTNVTAPDAETVELGTITYPRIQRDRTYVEWLRDVFAGADDPTATVETAIGVAALDGRRVLLIEGEPDDAFVRSLFRVLDDDSRTWDPGRDPLIQNLSHYILLGFPRIDTQAGNGVSRIVILDHDRSLVAEAAAEELTGDSGEADATQLTQFLGAHLPPPVDADDRLTQAMESSNETGKPILVLQVAAHDDQSERMLEFVVQTRSLLERHFILFPVSEHMSRGRELTRALRESLVDQYVDPRQRQVPWTAVIDASGARVAAAEIDEMTVGYPNTPEKIDALLGTLLEGAPGISDVELKQLREALVPGT